MKKKLCVLLIFVLLFLLQLSKSHAAPRRLLLHEQERQRDSWAWATQADSSSEMNKEFSNLIGEEKCDEKDEECVKRRMIADAHLDYIYTQSHKP